jgi:cobalt-zinc-cadmium resistance protein CzcA
VPGVADVNSLGGFVTTFEVVPDNGRMAANGIQLSELRDAIAANNRNDGAGRLDEGEEALLVRSEGAIRPWTTWPHRRRRRCAAAGARRRYRRGAPVGADPLWRRHPQRRRRGVEGLVLGLRGANARAVVEGVQAKLDELSVGLPDGVTIDVFYDRGVLVDKAVHTVARRWSRRWCWCWCCWCCSWATCARR